MTTPKPPRLPADGRTRRRRWLHLRRASRFTVIVAAAVAAGAVCVGFAKLCDGAMTLHASLIARSAWLGPLLLVVGFPLAAWLTQRVAPAASGSGIPQVLAALEGHDRRPGQGGLASLRTAAFKVLATAGLLVAGASIGREGPSVQIAAAVVGALTARLRGGPSRRALLISGGAAGIAGAFNTPIAGVVFAVEELARGFDRRTNAVVILTVVAAGAASYALAGNYAYFGELAGEARIGGAWFMAPVLGAVGGLMGGLFSRALLSLIGPKPGRIGQWRAAHPVLFAAGCGVVAAVAAIASRGLTYGTGYAEAASLLGGHPGRGFSLASSKFVANLAASASGAPGGIFAPALAAGAGLGAGFARFIPFLTPRDGVVLGMVAYLAGVVQAPLTSAVILMEMTRDPGLVGPLMLSALVARGASRLVQREPIYHVLAGAWRRAPGTGES